MDRRTCLSMMGCVAASPLTAATAAPPDLSSKIRPRDSVASHKKTPGRPKFSCAPAGGRDGQRPALGGALKVYIPAGTGGGWDQTGRALGAALQDSQFAQRIEYENKAGKGGTLGLADFVERYGKDPHALFIGGMVMLGAIAVNQPPVTLRQLTPLARLTSDYMVLVVKPGGKITQTRDLVAQLRRDLASVSFTGGSAGGVDHMLAGMVLRALRLDIGAMRYLPTSSGREALEQLSSGMATVAISGYSEFKLAIESKAVLPLAVSSRKLLFGIPSLREQGIDTELANWRAVFAPIGITPAQTDVLRQAVVRATDTSSWRQSLLDASWVGSLLYGQDLERFIEIETGMATVVTHMLKLKS